MTGLIIKLAPRERILINGAVIENCDKRSKIVVKTKNVNVLRLKDALHPSDLDTPISYAYHLSQLILSGDVDRDAGKMQLLTHLDFLAENLTDASSLMVLESAKKLVLTGNVYRSMKRLHVLLSAERSALNNR